MAGSGRLGHRVPGLLALALLTLTGCAGGDRAKSLDVVAALYAGKCADCHGEGLEGAAQGPSLLVAPLPGGNGLPELRRSIAVGAPEAGMPAWQARLSDSEIERLAMFVLERQAGFTYADNDEKGEPLVVTTQPRRSERVTFRAESVAGGLGFPFSIAPLPDGRILVTEKTRGLSIIGEDGVRSGPIEGTPPVYDDDEWGGFTPLGSGWMHDVALHPRYAENGWIYLSYADRCDACNELSRRKHKPVSMLAIVRGRIRDGRWVDEQSIWRVPRSQYLTGHNQALGGRLAFDAAGDLYFSVGGMSRESGIQDLDRPIGKIHRVHDDGSIPSNNPFVDVPGALASIWSLGHRNPQGLDFDPRDDAFWETEHGPRGGDELNRILPGRNYGWPMVSHGMWYDGNPIRFAEELGLVFDPSALTAPVAHWTPSPGISSLAFYAGELFPEWSQSVLVGTLRQQDLLRLELENGVVVHAEKLLEDFGRMRDVEVGSRGEVYLLVEQYHGSQIVKLTPVPAAPVTARSGVARER